MAEASGAHRHPREWVINIEQDLESYVKTTTSLKRRRPILRVASRLRELRREQFVPQHLFVGLYQSSSYDHNDRKSTGHIFKLAVVGAFLADSGKSHNDWGEISARIVKDPKAMLEKYNEDGLDDFSTEEVRSMLSMDAIFLAWFCTQSCWNQRLKDALRGRFPSVFYVVLGEDGTFSADVTDDILKLENQIPLELIRNALLLFFEIFNEKHGTPQESTPSSRDIGDAQTQADELLQHICTFMAVHDSSALPGSMIFRSEVIDNLNFKDNCEHFLHCVYFRLIREPSDQTELRTYAAPDGFCGPLHRALNHCFNRRHRNSFDNKPSNPTEARPDSAAHRLCGSAQSVLKCCFNRNTTGNPETMILDIPAASQLRKAGINFHGKQGLEAKFEKHLFGATLYLPKMHDLGDNCQAWWRNLLAFEDHYESKHPFKSYLIFMDELIDFQEDETPPKQRYLSTGQELCVGKPVKRPETEVALLRHGRNPVFASVGVGSNAEVARIFNSMTTGYDYSSSDSWNSVRVQVLDYYNNKTRKTWVEFRRTNFGKPWLFASFLAAVALLVLTFLQTLFAILAYKYTF